jgi:DNA-binding response OmpR family regulator
MSISDEFIFKPFHPEELIKLINNIIKKNEEANDLKLAS